MVGTYDGASIAVYVDGDLVAQRSMTSAPTAGAAKFEIGDHHNGGAFYWTGRIDEVALYDRAISASDVRAHAIAGRGVAMAVAASAYDIEGHPTYGGTEFLVNGAFEAGTEGWTRTDATGGTYSILTSGANGGFQAAQLTNGATIESRATLVPGQTARLQLYADEVSGTGTYSIQWQQRSTGGWSSTWGTTSLANQPIASGGWQGTAYDLTVPMEGTGVVRITVATAASTTLKLDDVALVTDYGTTTYGADGLPATTTALPIEDGSGTPRPTIVATTSYAPSAVHPAILATSVVANDVATADDPDEDATTTRVYDAWGRATSGTDPDGMPLGTTTYAANAAANGYQTDVASTTDPAGLVTSWLYDDVGNPASVTGPDGAATATVYDRGNRATDVTAHDGTTTHTDYSTAGLPTLVDVGRSGAGATDGVKTVTAYDKDGLPTEVHGDCQAGSTPCGGGVDAVTQTGYDAMGNAVESTTYPEADAGGTARTTVNFYETVTATWNGASRTVTRLSASGTRLPIAPTGGGAPTCPGTASTLCNTASVPVTITGAVYPRSILRACRCSRRTRTARSDGPSTTSRASLSGRSPGSRRGKPPTPTRMS